MRTQDEIKSRVSEITVRGDDIFGTERSNIMEFATRETIEALVASGGLGPISVDDIEGEIGKQQDRDAIIEKMRDYMTFAQDKALNHRSLSASRSVAHFRGWAWLLGDDGEVDWDEYAMYGVPILSAICKRYGFPEPETSDWRQMSIGEPCETYCVEGCRA